MLHAQGPWLYRSEGNILLSGALLIIYRLIIIIIIVVVVVIVIIIYRLSHYSEMYRLVIIIIIILVDSPHNRAYAEGPPTASTGAQQPEAFLGVLPLTVVYYFASLLYEPGPQACLPNAHGPHGLPTAQRSVSATIQPLFSTPQQTIPQAPSTIARLRTIGRRRPFRTGTLACKLPCLF